MAKFHFRGFISLLLSISFLVVVFTGLVLWLSHSPQTFGIGKGAWKHAHIFVRRSIHFHDAADSLQAIAEHNEVSVQVLAAILDVAGGDGHR